MGWHPALDDIEASAGETDAHARTAGRRRQRDNREPSTRRLAPGAAGRCWCGDLLGHDWEGKRSGAPHPRVAPDGLLACQVPGDRGESAARPQGPAARMPAAAADFQDRAAVSERAER